MVIAKPHIYVVYRAAYLSLVLIFFVGYLEDNNEGTYIGRTVDSLVKRKNR